MLLRISITTITLAAVPAVAFADPEWELGAAAGGHDFSHSTELGTYDAPGYPGPSSGTMEGARLTLAFSKRLAVEAEGVMVQTKDDVLGMPAAAYGLRSHVRVNLLTGSVRPFVLAGAGMMFLESSSPQLFDDYDWELHWGVGVSVALSDHVDLRIDGRQLMVPDRTVISSHINGATFDYESTLGLSYRFGEKVKAIPQVAPPEIEKEPEPVAEPEPAPPPPPPAPPPPPPQPLPELAGIGFELDSAKITTVSRPILERAFDLLDAHPHVVVEISGHTSSEGDPARNVALSQARADAVKAYLVNKGIAEDRIKTIGHGAEDPVSDNTSDGGRRKNRRIEFRIVEGADGK
jgi:outer membrane protein OmpA-like peptidoglycan-associated protein